MVDKEEQPPAAQEAPTEAQVKPSTSLTGAKKPAASKVPPKRAKTSGRSAEGPAQKNAKRKAKKSRSVKAAVKTPARKAEVLKPVRDRTVALQVLFIVIAIALIVVGLLLVINPQEVTDHQESNDTGAQGTGAQGDGQVAVLVNGDRITVEQLDRQYSLLPEAYKAVFSRQMVLQQLIDEQLMLQYAKRQGLSVTPQEVNEEIQRTLVRGGMTAEDLEQNLAQFNLTQEDFERLVERKLIIQQGMDLLLSSVPEPTEEEVRAYYDDNIDSFVTDQQVTVRHILIAPERDDAAVLAKSIKERVEQGAEFCDLVTEYTYDIVSKDTCGEYTFPRGWMVPEFEEASFSMAPGDVTLIQTEFGYHIIEKLKDIPADTQPFTDVADGIFAQLLRQAQTERYQAFLAEQKASGDIQILYTA